MFGKYTNILLIRCILLSFIVSIPTVYSIYELTPEDEVLLERGERKIMALIDHDPDDHITRQRIVEEFARISQNPRLSLRFKRLLEELTARIYYTPVEEPVRSLAEDEYEIPLAVYSYSGQVLDLQSGTPQESYTALWEFFVSLFPAERTDRIHEVVFYANETSDTAAFVERRAEDSTQWRVAINESGINRSGDRLADLQNAELFIHEMMHIVTLNESQMDYVITEHLDAIAFEQEMDNCPTHLVLEGCLTEDAYLYQFVSKYWNDAQFESIAFDENIYGGNPQAFVNAYAATNEGEDIAESFTHFMLQRPPTYRNGQAEQKIQFFAQFPEFVSMQKTIKTMFFTDNQ